jgi:hypothetical protein
MYDTYLRRISILNEHCDSINRDHREIIKAWYGTMFIVNDKYKQAELGHLKRFIANKLKDSFWKDNLDLIITGTPEHIIKEIERYISIGVSYFIIHFVDLPSRRSLRLFARQIMPHFLN